MYHESSMSSIQAVEHVQHSSNRACPGEQTELLTRQCEKSAQAVHSDNRHTQSKFCETWPCRSDAQRVHVQSMTDTVELYGNGRTHNKTRRDFTTNLHFSFCWQISQNPIIRPLFSRTLTSKSYDAVLVHFREQKTI